MSSTSTDFSLLLSVGAPVLAVDPGVNVALALERMVACAAGMSIGAGKCFGEDGRGEVEDGSVKEEFG
jgi:hypothetical protein